MVKKKSNSSHILIILAIVLFVLGIIMIGINVFEYVQEQKVNVDNIESVDLSNGGIVSINIVENSDTNKIE